MNTKNKIHAFCWLFMVLLLMNSCENDGDTIYLSTPASNELLASEKQVELTFETREQIALSFAWTKTTLHISDPDMYAPDVLITTLEASLSEDFSSTVVETGTTGLSKSFTGGELNTVARNVGIEPETEKEVYFRLGLKTGTNMEPVYSNTVSVTIKSYRIDMRIGYILDTAENPTGTTLYSPEENGIYSGFMGVGSWENLLFQEGDETIWRGYPAEGTAFRISTEGDWSMWFPGQSGCYYVIMDTQAAEWSALYLPSLQISGDISGEMTYSRSTGKWSYNLDAVPAGTYAIRVSTTGKQYNVNTSTEDDDAIDTPIGFKDNGGQLEMGTEAGTISITVPTGSDYAFIIDLNNPQE
ncbi:MAG: DUF5114 domain-containing protein [Tannerellaceae bacterium]|nr:DUF5114 domain-containing protein [Tannerellaceae bacterium]